MKLSETLRAFREYNGFTQKQVADLLRMDRSTYAYYESGKTSPDLDSIMKLARIYKVTPNDLLGFDKVYINVSDNETVEYANNIYDVLEDNSLNSISELDRGEKRILMLYRLIENKERLLDYAKELYKSEIGAEDL